VFPKCETVGTPLKYNRKIYKNDTLSEHLHNIIEKSTRDDTLSEHLHNIIEK
jgi:hypothetical protein